MSFPRIVMFGAAGVLAVLAVACGDTTNVTNVFATAEDGGGDALGSGLDGAVSGDAADGGSDAAPASCGNDTRPVSDFCTIEGPCTSAQCSEKDSMKYVCANTDGGTRPNLQGCNHINSNTPGGDTWCCPRACVPVAMGDMSMCEGGQYFVCPYGEPRQLPTNCARQGNSNGGERWCCP